MNTLQIAARLIQQNARPLDIARYFYFFEGGDRKWILQILQAYQNKDGGFGNGLLPETLNPESSPRSTRYAIDLLREMNFDNAQSPVIRGICRYLDNTPHCNGKQWASCIPSDNEYPHVAAFGYASEWVFGNLFAPSATLAGFALKYAVVGSDLYKKAAIIARHIVAEYLKAAPIESFDALQCLIQLYMYTLEAEKSQLYNMQEFHAALHRNLLIQMEKDNPAQIAQLVPDKLNVFYEICKKPLQQHCKQLKESIHANGVWDLDSDFTYDRPEWRSAEAISQMQKKAQFAVDNLLLLRNLQGQY